MRTMIIAHRGWSAQAPENTMAAFRLAMEFNVDGIELDVHLSRDGHVVICHDERLDRTTDGSGLIVEHTLAQLKELDAGRWFSEMYAGERIPTLREFFEAVAASAWRGLINVELKSGPSLYPGLEQAVADLAREFDLVERVLVSSFNHYALVEMKRIAPEIKTAALYMEGLYEPWKYAQSIGCHALHPVYVAAQPPIVQGAHQAGMIVNAWTVNDAQVARLLASAGVDGIITDQPDRIREALSAA